MRVRWRAGRALLAVGALAASLLVLVPSQQAQARPNLCEYYGGFGPWLSEQDMIDASAGYCRSTFVDDPGQDNLLSRQELLAAAGLYQGQGFHRQFLWYAPETSITVPGGSGIQWQSCEPVPQGNPPGGPVPCLSGRFLPNQLTTIFGYQTVSLHAFAFDNRFIVRGCGNNSVGIAGADPVPTVTGHKYADLNHNGQRDPGEGGIGGVTFQLIRQWSTFGDQGTGLVASTTSDADGNFAFALDGQGPGGYDVHEVLPDGSISTTGLDQSFVVNAGSGSANVADLQFGNRPEHPPVPNAGPDQQLDQTSDAGATVQLDGTGSSDADGDPLTYSWSWPTMKAPVSGPTPSVTLPVGTTLVTLTVSDGIDSATGTTSITVFPNIAAKPTELTGTEGAPFSGTVATFTDPDPIATADEYRAQVDWGDGTASSATISKGADGTFSVDATHDYTEEGSYSARVTIVDADNAYNTATAVDDVTVADAALTAEAPMTVTAVEGSGRTQAVATFTDADPAGVPADFTATVHWGDGTAASPGVVSQQPDGTFTVTGTHDYAEEGSYQVKVDIADAGGSTATAEGQAAVSDAPLTAAEVDGLSTNPVQQAVATFTDANPGGALADFAATVDWGDGSAPTPGVIDGQAGGTFTVTGSHSYDTLGPKLITVHIVDDGGADATVVSHLLIYAFPSSGNFVIGDQNSAVGDAVTYWGAQWAKVNGLSGGPAPAAFKGYADGTDAAGWTAGPGNSGHPVDSVPTYLAVLVTDAAGQHGSTIAGDAPHVVIVRTDPGYRDDPGHPGTGTVVATLR